MKKSFLLFAFVVIANMLATAYPSSNDEIPKIVQDSFASRHPGIKAKWEKEDLKYEANFEKDGKEMSAVFDVSGKLLETEIEIEFESLPKTISEYLQKNNKGKIKEASKITNASGLITYEVEVGKSDLMFDAQGNFISENKH